MCIDISQVVQLWPRNEFGDSFYLRIQMGVGVSFPLYHDFPGSSRLDIEIERVDDETVLLNAASKLS